MSSSYLGDVCLPDCWFKLWEILDCSSRLVDPSCLPRIIWTISKPLSPPIFYSMGLIILPVSQQRHPIPVTQLVREQPSEQGHALHRGLCAVGSVLSYHCTPHCTGTFGLPCILPELLEGKQFNPALGLQRLAGNVLSTCPWSHIPMYV